MVMRHGVLATTLMVVLLSGGCTAASSSPVAGGEVSSTTVASSSDTEGSSSGVALPADGLPQAQSNTPMSFSPPLAKYGVYLDGPGPDPGAVAARQAWFDNLANATAECMTAQGFEYTPNPLDVSQVDSSSLSSLLSVLPVPLLPQSRDQVAQVGYGVYDAPDDLGGGMDDPNVAYSAGLSPSEFQAYQLALYGDYNDPAGTSGASCSGRAAAQFPEPAISDREQMFEADFRDLIYSVQVSLADDGRPGGMLDDPRVSGLNGEWEACMKAGGYVFDGMDGILSGPKLASDLAVRTRPDGTVGPPNYDTPTVDIPIEERNLLGTEPERAVALADFDCRTETDYMARLTDIRVSRDEDFIAEHQSELDRLVAAADTW